MSKVNKKVFDIWRERSYFSSLLTKGKARKIEVTPTGPSISSGWEIYIYIYTHYMRLARLLFMNPSPDHHINHRVVKVFPGLSVSHKRESRKGGRESHGDWLKAPDDVRQLRG